MRYIEIPGKDGQKYYFDAGPSLLLLPNVYKETFESIGMEDWQTKVPFLDVDPNYRVVFDDKNSESKLSFVDLFRDAEKMKDQFEAIEKGSFAKYKEYVKAATAFYRIGFPAFVKQELDSPWPLISNPLKIPGYASMLIEGGNPFQLHESMLKGYFKTNKLIDMNLFQGLYVGLGPSNSPAVFSLLFGLEMEEGVKYPKHGFRNIVEQLIKHLQEMKIYIRTNKLVTSFVMDESGQEVLGVQCADGSSFSGDTVIVNGDFPFVQEHFVTDKGRGKGKSFGSSKREEKTKNYTFSSSVVSLFFAFDKQVPHLQQHTIFLGPDRTSSWQGIFDQPLYLPETGNFYVHAPSRTDPSVCPLGHDTIMVLVPCGGLRRDMERILDENQDLSEIERIQAMDRDLVQKARHLVLDRFERLGILSRAEFQKHLIGEHFVSPLQWYQDLRLARGAVFGLSHQFTQLSMFRPGYQDDEICNLYYVGASNRSGNGVPLVMIGAEHCSNRVLQNWRDEVSG